MAALCAAGRPLDVAAAVARGQRPQRVLDGTLIRASMPLDEGAGARTRGVHDQETLYPHSGACAS
jgi:hypothetical protein